MQDHKHTISDPGHNHKYVDKYTSYFGDPYPAAENGFWGPNGGDKLLDRFDKAHNSGSTKTPTGVAVKGVSSGKSGLETRPKNMNVIYIMRVW